MTQLPQAADLFLDFSARSPEGGWVKTPEDYHGPKPAGLHAVVIQAVTETEQALSAIGSNSRLNATARASDTSAARRAEVGRYDLVLADADRGLVKVDALEAEAIQRYAPRLPEVDRPFSLQTIADMRELDRVAFLMNPKLPRVIPGLVLTAPPVPPYPIADPAVRAHLVKIAVGPEGAARLAELGAFRDDLEHVRGVATRARTRALSFLDGAAEPAPAPELVTVEEVIRRAATAGA